MALEAGWNPMKTMDIKGLPNRRIAIGLQHAVFVERFAQLGDGVVIERLLRLEALDLGTQRRVEPPELQVAHLTPP